MFCVAISPSSQLKKVKKFKFNFSLRNEMQNDFGIYCFSINELEIQSHEFSGQTYEAIDISQPNIFEHRDLYNKNTQSSILWCTYAMLNDLGTRYKYCYKLNDNDPQKLFTFRLKHDPIKICKYENNDSIDQLIDLYQRMCNVAAMHAQAIACSNNSLVAIADDDDLMNESLAAFKQVEYVKEKIKAAINEEFTEKFCRF